MTVVAIEKGKTLVVLLQAVGETDEEGQVRQLISERPITSLASAFALGVVVGFAMRR